MAKERPRKKSRSTADGYLFLPQANEKQEMGEREGKRERERGRERERQQEGRTTVKLMILGVVLVVSCTCMLQYACFSLFFPLVPP